MKSVFRPSTPDRDAYAEAWDDSGFHVKVYAYKHRGRTPSQLKQIALHNLSLLKKTQIALLSA